MQVKKNSQRSLSVPHKYRNFHAVWLPIFSLKKSNLKLSGIKSWNSWRRFSSAHRRISSIFKDLQAKTETIEKTSQQKPRDTQPIRDWRRQFIWKCSRQQGLNKETWSLSSGRVDFKLREIKEKTKINNPKSRYWRYWTAT